MYHFVVNSAVSEKFYIGAKNDGAAEADGSIGELAVWSKVLSLEEIKAIYYATFESYHVKSGYTNLPPRVRRRAQDNMPGCYPTKHRMGDKDRKGTYNTSFNDNHTIIFGKKILVTLIKSFISFFLNPIFAFSNIKSEL